MVLIFLFPFHLLHLLVYFRLIISVLHEHMLLFLQVYLHQLGQIEFTGSIIPAICALFSL